MTIEQRAEELAREEGRMQTKQIIPHTGPRVETGAVQFGDDWPGLFIRGDCCMGIISNLDMIEFALKNPNMGSPAFALASIASLRELLGTPIQMPLNDTGETHAN